MKKSSEDIKMPKTKKQKQKLKYKKLLLVVAVLLIILVVLVIISMKSKPKDTKQVIKKEEKKIEEKLSVFDFDSNTRPYAVMIPNDGVAKKRHYGLQKAYLVYEITVEGGITRLMALFKDVDIDRIGPTRSSRHYYLDYAMENDAIYVHFGWSPQAQSDISTLGINNLNGIYNPSNMFWRAKEFDSPNNAYTSTNNIKKAAEDKKYRMTSDDYILLNYKKNVELKNDETLKNAKNVKIDYMGTYVKYVYDETNGYYLRFNNDNQDIDLATNEQIHVKNIIVEKADTISISGDQKGRQNLNNIGTGNGYFITNGKSIEITWSKKDRKSKTIYKNKNGEVIDVSDGNTYIQIQPVNKSITIE